MSQPSSQLRRAAATVGASLPALLGAAAIFSLAAGAAGCRSGVAPVTKKDAGADAAATQQSQDLSVAGNPGADLAGTVADLSGPSPTDDLSASPADDLSVAPGVDLARAPVDLAGRDLASTHTFTPPDFSGLGDIALGCTPKVNELQTTGKSPTSAAGDEFVELYNPCSDSIDLKGWTLVYRSDGNNSGAGDSLLFTFTASTPIAASAFLVYAGSGFSSASDGKLSGGLKSSGGAVGLRNTIGELVDSVSYGKLTTTNALTEGSPAAAPTDGNSIGRIPDGADTDDNSQDWKPSTKATPGAANQ